MVPLHPKLLVVKRQGRQGPRTLLSCPVHQVLKTYVPEEFYVYGPSPSVDEGSQITVEPAAKAPKSSKVKASKCPSSWMRMMDLLVRLGKLKWKYNARHHVILLGLCKC
ncbi:hypothetical protein QL285_086684 [Trifolium repens]|nr:hypothetical protein QL285_086684 [Trifolium repens]